jgi:hypothetical protein
MMVFEVQLQQLLHLKDLCSLLTSIRFRFGRILDLLQAAMVTQLTLVLRQYY